MGSSRFLPLVIAGLIGLFVGWLFGPDVDDIEEAQTARFDQLDAKIAALQAPLTAVQAAVAEQAKASAAPLPALADLTTKVDAIAVAVSAEVKSGVALGTGLADLQAKLDALAAAPPAPAAAAGSQADTLAAQIGNTGAVLLAGQTAIFGDKRLTLASVADG